MRIVSEGRLLKFDGTEWRVDTDENGLPYNDVCTFFEDRDDNFWIGTRSELSRFDGIHWKQYPFKWVTSLTQDREGTVWANASISMVSIQDTTVTIYSEEDGLPASECKAIIPDPVCGVWTIHKAVVS